MGLLLNPNTGKQVTWYEELSWLFSGSYAANRISAEKYTSEVIKSNKLDQTAPWRISLRGLIFVIIIILSIFYFIVKPFILKK